MCRAKLLGGPHPSPESCASHWHCGQSLPELEISFRKTFLKPLSKQFCWGITQLWAPLHLPTCLRDFKRTCLDQNNSSAGLSVRNNRLLILQKLRGPRVPALFCGMVRCNGCKGPGDSTSCSYVVPAARTRVGDSQGCSWTQSCPMNITRKKSHEAGSFWSPPLLSGGAPN